jgi:hypothetical protein
MLQTSIDGAEMFRRASGGFSADPMLNFLTPGCEVWGLEMGCSSGFRSGNLERRSVPQVLRYTAGFARTVEGSYS